MKKNKNKYRYTVEVIINKGKDEENLSEEEIAEIHVTAINTSLDKSNFYNKVEEELNILFKDRIKMQKNKEEELDEWFRQL